MSKETPEERFRKNLFSTSQEKPKPEAQLQRRRGDEPQFEFDWKISREDSSRGPIIVLEFVNRANDDDATRFGLEPTMAKELGKALTANANV